MYNSAVTPPTSPDSCGVTAHQAMDRTFLVLGDLVDTVPRLKDVGSGPTPLDVSGQP